MADAFTNKPIDLTIYTDRVVLRGSVVLPYRRVLDLLNSEDREYINIDRATVAPFVARTSKPARTARRRCCGECAWCWPGWMPTRRRHCPMIRQPSDRSASPCLGFVGPYVFRGYFLLMRGQRLIDMLEAQRSDFILFNDVALYQTERPDLPPHQHAGLVVDRAMLDILYLL